MTELKITLCVSGILGYEILKYLNCEENIKIINVFTDRKSDEIIEYCKNNGLLCFKGNPRNGNSVSFIKNCETPDVLLSVNYLFIIEKDLIEYPKMYAINVHGSLLPKYRGRTPHVWSIINNEKYCGITCHLINEECDKGDIILQRKIPITDNDTGGSLLNKYKEEYPNIIKDLITMVMSDSISLIRQDESKSTYYPKRRPEDGLIDFSWQRERVYNWIRAMAPPEYPGAFYYDNGRKIIASRSELDDTGFPVGTSNGTIVFKTEDYNIIKLSNGCLKIYGGGGTVLV